MQIVIGEMIRNLRKVKGASQEALAEVIGVSVQAVSKWECETSYPDITYLPQIAEYFGVSVDYLLMGENGRIDPISCDMPDDNILRIVQYKGNCLLSNENYDPSVRIMLKIDKDNYMGDKKPPIHVEVWGSADIQGNISGGVQAGGSVNCGNVTGGVNAGDGVNCGNITGGVNAGDGVNCGNVDGGVDAGDHVNCGNIGGDVNAEDSINCGDINGNILSCSGDVHCNKISGDVHCEGDIIYENK